MGWAQLIAALEAAGVAIFGSIGLEKVDSTLATALRSIIMAVMLVAVTLSTGQLQTIWHGKSNLDSRPGSLSSWLALRSRSRG